MFVVLNTIYWTGTIVVITSTHINYIENETKRRLDIQKNNRKLEIFSHVAQFFFLWYGLMEVCNDGIIEYHEREAQIASSRTYG